MSKIYKSIVIGLLGLVTMGALAGQEKVLQIFRNGEVIQEYDVADIDYVEVNDVPSTPGKMEATEGTNQITITWEAVKDATYKVYRSGDNQNFEMIASGLTETSYTDTNPLQGVNFYKVKAVVGTVESDFSQVISAAAKGTVTGNGIYLGIIGFNSDLYEYPIERLSQETENQFCSFVDNLTTAKLTKMYYAVDKSIDKLQQTSFPANLHDVAIITFTDGLDRGSLDVTDKYLTNTEYLDSIHARLTKEKIYGQQISAYSVGIKGPDVTNTTSFKRNLTNLATSADNVFEVSNMDEVNKVFLDIANSLSETRYVQKFRLETAAPSHNEKCRFTFDNVSNYSSSKLYIEGTFNRLDKTLTDLKYVGLTSTSGTTVKGEATGNGSYVFTFEGLQASNGELIPTEYVKSWYTEEGIWDKDREFVFNPDDADIEKVKRSAAIMLNLDCSSSLEGEDFRKLQNNAKLFIQKLVDNAVDPYEVSSVSLDKNELTMAVGSTQTLTATVLPSTAKLKKVHWTSSDESVATVDETGLVTAHSPGNAIITVTTEDGGYTASCRISVVTLVESVELQPSILEIYVGDHRNVELIVKPDNATNKTVVWRSSDHSIVTFDDTGIVGVAPGKARIHVSTNDGSNKTASCDVTVLQHVESVTLNESELTLLAGKTQQLTAKISPENASNKNLVWSSSDESVVSVNQKGMITAISKGKTVISAKSIDGDIKGECAITVIQPVSQIVLDNENATLNAGESLQLSASVFPEDAGNKTLKWSTSSSAIATVDPAGIVTALAPGKAEITAKATDGSEISKTCIINVNQPVTGLILSPNKTTVVKGSKNVISVGFIPYNATNQNYTVVSSDPSIVTVSQNGIYITITGVNYGSATITVTSEDGEYTASAALEVTPHAAPVHLALSVKKDDVRYYIPLAEYTGSIPSGYSKEGLTISSGSTFILNFNNAVSSKKTFKEAQSYGTLPTSSQAQAISSDWTAINNALSKYGGTTLGSNSYWTSTSRGAGAQGYYYSSSGVVFASSTSATNYVRCIKAIQ